MLMGHLELPIPLPGAAMSCSLPEAPLCEPAGDLHDIGADILHDLGLAPNPAIDVSNLDKCFLI